MKECFYYIGFQSPCIFMLFPWMMSGAFALKKVYNVCVPDV